MIIASFAFINFVVCCSVFTLHASFLQSLVIFSLDACLAVVATCKNTDGVKLAIDSCVLERFLCRRHSGRLGRLRILTTLRRIRVAQALPRTAGIGTDSDEHH